METTTTTESDSDDEDASLQPINPFKRIHAVSKKFTYMLRSHDATLLRKALEFGLDAESKGWLNTGRFYSTKINGTYPRKSALHLWANTKPDCPQETVRGLFDLLMRTGAHHLLNACDAWTPTPLEFAVASECNTVFDLLLTCPNINIAAYPTTMQSPLQTAISRRSLYCVEQLLLRFYQLNFSSTSSILLDQINEMIPSDRCGDHANEIRVAVQTAILVAWPQYLADISELLHDFSDMPSVLVILIVSFL
jgi:hypothetical protein